MHTTIQIDSNTILRRVGIEDASAMFALIESQREYLVRWLPFIHFTETVADSRAFLESVVATPEDAKCFVFAIIVSGEFAGLIGFKDTDNANLKTEIGYWLGQQFQGRGIMTNSVKALCYMAFRELGMNRVQIKVALGNHKSANIPKRLGFIYEGEERAGELTERGSFRDLETYSLLSSEF